MKTLLPSFFLLPFLACAQDLLFQDTFDAPDTNNLDLSDQTDRRTGLAREIQIRSSRIQHGIVANQLNFLDVRTGRIRFHRDPDNNPTTAGVWHNWAGDPTGPLLLEGGGIRVEFDWNAGNDTSANWISVNMGINQPGTPEPGFRVNHVETDIGMLFRFNGLTQLFDNGTDLGVQGSFAPTIAVRHVVMDFLFDSFDNVSPVSVIASVDGTEVFNGGGFTWDNNFGELYFEIGTLENTLLDNVKISTVNSVYNIQVSDNFFSSGAPQGTLVGDLSAEIGGNPDPSSFALVDGEGSGDNDKFQINGSRLEVGAFEFTGANSFQGQEYSLRVRGTGSETRERILTLTLTKDDDFDTLPDGWENRWTGNLADLSGSGDQDFDQDGLSDAAEYEASVIFPDLDPTTRDSDGDGLDDGEEVNPTGTRPQTNPTLADSDLDGLSDAVESNSGLLVDENDTGTNPTLCDTDGDFASDAWEIARQSNPFDADDLPAPVGPVTIVPITDAASSGIDADKTYTHLVSGGQGATVNGVVYDTLSTTLTPSGFLWDTNGFTVNQVLNTTRDWMPFESGVDVEIESLLSSFIYSGNGNTPGSSQRFTLLNLTPGVTYDLRIYTRMWAADFSGRPIDLVFTNGTEVVQPFGSLPFDRPGITTGSGNNNDAYYLNYRYTAQTTDLVIDTIVPLCGDPTSGSFHLYALSNEVATSGPPGQIVITGQSVEPDGRFIIDFTARSQTTYQVTKSSGLAEGFSSLSPSLSITTDANGNGRATVPASETTDQREFYRIEE